MCRGFLASIKNRTSLPLLKYCSSSSAVFSNDVNQVTLLGSVASMGATIDEASSGQIVATFNLLTRARYRAADRYLMKLVYHRIHVFDRPLIERVRNISQGDRMYVRGCLSSFKKSTNDWMQCITAQNIILHSDAGKEALKDMIPLPEEEVEEVDSVETDATEEST